MQIERSSADLIVKLANIALKSSSFLQQMNALYDGTKPTLQTLPDIGLFSSKYTGMQASLLLLFPASADADVNHSVRR